MRDHTKLKAFELADEMVFLIYRATREFPKEEMYGWFFSKLVEEQGQRVLGFKGSSV